MSKYPKRLQLTKRVLRNSFELTSSLKSLNNNQFECFSPLLVKPINLNDKARPTGHQTSSNKLQKMDREYKRVSTQFQKLIDIDKKNGKSLQDIKSFIDVYVKRLVTNRPVTYVKQVESLSRENFELSKVIEKLRTAKSKEEMPTAKRYRINRNLPPLTFSKLPVLDFHQEFLSQANEFSASWREALEHGR